MKGLNEKALPVVDASKRLIGAIGMREVMDVLWTSKKAARTPNEIMGGRNPPDINVGSIMNRPAIAVTPEDTIGKVATIMLEKHLSTIFVHEDGKLVGVVSQADLMEQIVGLKPREGVFVQLTGLDEEDPDVYEVLYGLIEKSMKRIDKIQSPKIFTVHVTVYHHEGMRSKYSLHARLTTEKSLYYASGTDWSLYKTLDALLVQLEKSIKKESEKQRDQRRTKQSS
jgi:CBS domain-containing protein/ribosome-associated translation inhibitor RaiA